MDTLSNRNPKLPGAEVIVSPEQLDEFEKWLKA